MAHELDIRNGKAAMFSVLETPWHGLGKVLAAPVNAKEAIIEAGLDWEVEKRPIYQRMNDGSFAEIPERFGVTRMDCMEVLGTVRDKYSIFQNSQCFDFVDSIVGEGHAVFHTAGALKRGAIVWALLKVDGDMIITEKDNVGKYLLMTSSHDGSSPVTCFFTPIRVVCNNTLTAAMKGKKTEIKIRHSGELSSKLQTARDVLGITLNWYKDFEFRAVKFQKYDLSSDKFEKYLRNVFPKGATERIETSLSEERSKVAEIYLNERNSGLSGQNLWSAWNSVCEYTDHGISYRGADKQDARVRGIWFGSGAELKTKAFEVADAMAN